MAQGTHASGGEDLGGKAAVDAREALGLVDAAEDSEDPALHAGLRADAREEEGVADERGDEAREGAEPEGVAEGERGGQGFVVAAVQAPLDLLEDQDLDRRLDRHPDVRFPPRVEPCRPRLLQHVVRDLCDAPRG
eukprot:3099395-Rhodomonas_salina.2